MARPRSEALAVSATLRRVALVGGVSRRHAAAAAAVAPREAISKRGDAPRSRSSAAAGSTEALLRSCRIVRSVASSGGGGAATRSASVCAIAMISAPLGVVAFT